MIHSIKTNLLSVFDNCFELLLTFVLFATLLIVLSSCAEKYEPVESSRPNGNSGITDELLYSKDGYSIHRFQDRGYYHYYVTPSGTTMNTIESGKTTRQETITTTAR